MRTIGNLDFANGVVISEKLGQQSVDRIDVDLEKIDQRLQQLMNFDRATSYAKQKDLLRKEFETFLRSIPGYVTLETMTSRRFLVVKDKDGKTQVHQNGCTYIGQKGRFGCGCPLCLSYKTLVNFEQPFLLLDEMVGGISV